MRSIDESSGGGMASDNDKNITPKRKRTVEENLAFARAKGAKCAAIVKTEVKDVNPALPVKCLEQWSDSARGVPNVILRSALFGISTEREVYKTRTLIASTKDVQIRFMGVTFTQTDLDILDMLMHMARLQPLGVSFEFSANEFLIALDRGVGKAQHEQLKDEIARLVSGMVEITYIESQKSFMGTLVRHVKRDDKTKRYVVTFEDDLLKLFGEGFTLMDWAQRQALGRNNLAKWLQGHYASHANPYPVKVETLHNLCGSADKSIKSFRQKLKSALDELVRVGSLKSWEILLGDLVSVKAVSSRSQLQHLSKKLGPRTATKAR